MPADVPPRGKIWWIGSDRVLVAPNEVETSTCVVLQLERPRANETVEPQGEDTAKARVETLIAILVDTGKLRRIEGDARQAVVDELASIASSVADSKSRARKFHACLVGTSRSNDLTEFQIWHHVRQWPATWTSEGARSATEQVADTNVRRRRRRIVQERTPASGVRLVPDITYLRGDATRPQRVGHKIIAHICNDVGGWGKGFVVAVSKLSPEPESQYRRWYRERAQNDFGLGAVQLVKVADDVSVANMIAQRGIRKRNGRPPIRYDAVEMCLTKVSEMALATEATVHMPRIGCGLAGGTWAEIEPVIRRTLVRAGVGVFVYDFG